jgi:hypothetical protein
MKVSAAALLFASLFLPFAYFNHSDGWNQGARLAQLHAMVIQGTLAIDSYHHVTGDKALIGGHYYSEKAPAIVMFALPAFSAAVFAQRRAGVDPDSAEGWRVSNWIATAGSIALIAASGGVAFFAAMRKRMTAFAALVSMYGLFLGTITFPYATAMFAHAGTVGLLAIALWARFEETPRHDHVAGLAAGFAVASEYPAILAAAAIGLHLAHADPRRAMRYAVALAPAAVLILANNTAIAGSPFSIGYGANPAFPEINAGNAFGFNLPDPEAIRALVWGEYRGLLFWSPVLLMAVPGIAVLFREDARSAWMVVAASASVVLQVGSFYSWFGGSAVGPRYLAPAIPFIGLAAAYGIKRFPIAGTVLTLGSVLLMGMVAAIAIDPPQDVLAPLRSFYLVRLQDDRFAANLGTLVGLSLETSLLVLIAFVLSCAAGIWLLVRETRAGDEA